MQKNKTHIEQFIGNVEELLRIDTPYATHGLRTLGGGSNDVWAHSGKREKIRKLSDQVVESGNRLAERLESTGHESTDVLTIVSFLENNESQAVRKIWPEGKLKLKRLEIQEATTDSGKIDCLVTLSQAAPLTGLRKRTLDRYSRDPQFPAPDIKGGGGKAHKWRWWKLRPALEPLSKKSLPLEFPASRIRPAS